MKLSIITVNLNNKAGLEATVTSVLSQTYTDFEYIIIDGGSTDGSVGVIDKQTKKLAYWVSESDSGVYNAMNKGIEKANGEYLLFLNSGDRLLEENTLLTASTYLNGSDIVYGNLRYELKDDFYDTNYPDKLSLSYLYEHYLPHPATFIRHELFKKIGNYEEQYLICADWVFFMKSLGLYGASYLHINQIITMYDTQGISAKEENQSIIKQERTQLLEEAFPLYIEDLTEYIKLKRKLEVFNKTWQGRLMRLLGFWKIK